MRLYISLVLSFVHFFIYAQDTIYKRSGEVLASKVIEINTKTVSYKRFDLVDGPLFILNKSDVKKIKYQNGAIDSFAVVAEEKPFIVVPSKQTITDYQNPEQIQTNFRKGIYLYHGHRISGNNVLMIAGDKNRTWKNKELDLAINTTRKNKKMQYMMGFGGAGLGAIMMIGAIAGSGSNNSGSGAVAGAFFVNGIGILIASQIVSKSFKKKRARSIDKVVELYNQNF